MPDYPFELVMNRGAQAGAPYDAAKRAILNDEAFEEARAAIGAWPGYAPTPLVPLPGIAAHAGVASVHYKDEAGRFGLGSFKALGGAYAVAQLLRREVAARAGGPVPSMDEILSGRHAEAISGVTVCCATDGNHGRSVAWGAQTFGCRCVIFIHETVSEGRERAIERFGARIVRTPGNYDDSVREAEATARREGWFVVSDTSYEGYTEIPKDVMQGYELMAAEVMEQTGAAETATHIFVQTGVGGMAAAVTAYFWRRLGRDRPKIVLADPKRSACWLDSFKAGRPTPVHGDLDTIMAGLACGEVSLLAWEILRTGADAVVAIDDEVAVDGMRLLAEGRFADRPVVAGESAVAGLGALLAVAAEPSARARLDLGPEARVLLFGTEGDTDPAVYRELVGEDAEAVRRRAAGGNGGGTQG